mmetsp:Transcript_33867/g.66025  ORF Transcript_33867/g.66025 Transcript_33867/m.66025 type:complete len:253 (-) Transcript_33867:139-897(-)
MRQGELLVDILVQEAPRRLVDAQPQQPHCQLTPLHPRHGPLHQRDQRLGFHRVNHSLERLPPVALERRERGKQAHCLAALNHKQVTSPQQDRPQKLGIHHRPPQPRVPRPVHLSLAQELAHTHNGFCRHLIGRDEFPLPLPLLFAFTIRRLERTQHILQLPLGLLLEQPLPLLALGVAPCCPRRGYPVLLPTHLALAAAFRARPGCTPLGRRQPSIRNCPQLHPARSGGGGRPSLVARQRPPDPRVENVTQN